ncbi:MAG: glycosyltransferase [Candidatus Kapabacteria bacterium]|nr:glycosyltransferase [Candidatus Kapabacteria bacterium]
MSVIVASRNEEKYISLCLDSLLNQTYKGRIIIIVVDGMSEDKSQSIVEEYIKNYDNIILLKNEGVNQAIGRNLGFTYAKTELVAYIDAHSYAEKDWLEELYTAYNKLAENDDRIIGVGSIYRNAENNNFTLAAEIAFESVIIGTTKASFLKRENISKVDNAYACLYSKTKLIEAGLYNPELKIGEDMELNNRLTYKLGYNLYVNPNAITYYFRRNSVLGIFKQQMNYGYWRLKVLNQLKMFNLKVIAPAVFLMTLGVLFLASFFSKFVLILFLTVVTFYITIILIATIYYSIKNRKFLGWLVFIFPAIHFGYGAGVMRGIIKGNF